MKLKEEKIYKSKTKYIPVYINESLYKELFGSYNFKEASDKLSEMFSKSHELENKIRDNLGAIGYDF